MESPPSPAALARPRVRRVGRLLPHPSHHRPRYRGEPHGGPVLATSARTHRVRGGLPRQTGFAASPARELGRDLRLRARGASPAQRSHARRTDRAARDTAQSRPAGAALHRQRQSEMRRWSRSSHSCNRQRPPRVPRPVTHLQPPTARARPPRLRPAQQHESPSSRARARNACARSGRSARARPWAGAISRGRAGACRSPTRGWTRGPASGSPSLGR